MLVRPALIAVTAFVFFSNTAKACLPPPPAVRLPSETDEAYKNRSEAVGRALLDEGRRSHQVMLYDKASRVSLAIVEQSKEIDAAGLPGRQIVVRPVAPFKGRYEQRPVTLTDRYLTSCGPVGGGPATTAPLGDYIVLFEGLFFGSSPGPYGITLTEVREPRLLKAIEETSLRFAEAAENKGEQP